VCCQAELYSSIRRRVLLKVLREQVRFLQCSCAWYYLQRCLLVPAVFFRYSTV